MYCNTGETKSFTVHAAVPIKFDKFSNFIWLNCVDADPDPCCADWLCKYIDWPDATTTLGFVPWSVNSTAWISLKSTAGVSWESLTSLITREQSPPISPHLHQPSNPPVLGWLSHDWVSPFLTGFKNWLVPTISVIFPEDFSNSGFNKG